MARFPKQKTPFNISDIVAKKQYDENNNLTFRGYGSDSSERQKQVFYIGSAPMERIVAFKAFFESVSLNLKKDTEVSSYASRNFQIIKEKSGTLSYDIVLNIPAHTVNEATNNLAKIEELQKMLLASKWSVGKKHTKDGKGKIARDEEFSFEGVSTKTRTSLPLFYTYYRNIINCGNKKVYKEVPNFNTLMGVGFPCYIESINYEPDVSAGFFDYNNYLWPKVITLNLTLNYESENLFDEFRGINKKTIMPFQMNGHYSRNDSSLFPFGVIIRDNDLPERPDEITVKTRDLTTQQMNDTGLDLNKQKAYMSIFLPGWRESESSANKQYDNLSVKKSRHVKFKPFIESFSRNVKTNVELADNANATINSRVAQNGIAFGGIEYTVKINIPSEDIDEAKKNCGKIQHLLRMFFKRYYDGAQNAAVPSGMAYEDYRSKLMVYMPHMIEKTESKGPAATAAAAYENSIPLFLQDLSFEMDLSAGFFEEAESNRVFPKVMSLDFKFIYNRPDLIRGLNKETGENKWYFAKTKKNQYSTSPELFPLGKKTFKLGKSK